MPADQCVFVVDADGQVRCLVGDMPPSLAPLLGPVKEIYRNSHVEPTSELSHAAVRQLAKQLLRTVKETQDTLPPCKWWADLTPLGPNAPVIGPFDTREKALEAEIKWLIDNHLPDRIRGEKTTKEKSTDY